MESQRLDHLDVERREKDPRQLACSECGTKLAGSYYYVNYSIGDETGPFGDLGEYYLCPAHAEDLLGALATYIR
jgi:hypothetical protein